MRLLPVHSHVMTTRTLAPIALLLLHAIASPAAPQAITIRNATVVNVETGRLLEHASVVVEGNRIMYVGVAP